MGLSDNTKKSLEYALCNPAASDELVRVIEKLSDFVDKQPVVEGDPIAPVVTEAAVTEPVVAPVPAPEPTPEPAPVETPPDPPVPADPPAPPVEETPAS